MAIRDARPRQIVPGSCSWCGHRPHVEACGATITALVDPRLGTDGGLHEAPCPCVWHVLYGGTKGGVHG